MNINIAAFLYLVAGVLFILALRGLSSPPTARQGNRFGMFGMGIAVLTTLALKPPSGVLSWVLLIVAVAIGGGIGAWRARTVRMTDMPQLIALFHALVGLAAGLRRGRRLLRAERFRHRFARQHRAGQPGRNVDRPGHRRDHAQRFDHRIRQARRPHVRQVDHPARNAT